MKFEHKTLPSQGGGSASFGVVTNQAQNNEIPETEQNQEQQQEIKKPIEIANDGSVIPQSISDSSSKETIDFNQLNKHASQEIREDKAEQLDYSLSPKQINKLKQKDLLIQKLEEENKQLRDDWQFEVERKRKGLSDKLKVAETVILQENEDMKKQVRGLQTKLDEVDNQVVKEDDKLLQGYKEVEIIKLDNQRLTWLMQTSRNSERENIILDYKPKNSRNSTNKDGQGNAQNTDFKEG